MSNKGFKKWKKDNESLYNELGTSEEKSEEKVDSDNMEQEIDAAPKNRKQRRVNLQRTRNSDITSKDSKDKDKKIENYKTEMFKLINEMKDSEEEDDADEVEGLLNESELAESGKAKRTVKSDDSELSDLLHNLDNDSIYKSDDSSTNDEDGQHETTDIPQIDFSNRDVSAQNVRTVRAPIKKGRHKMAAPIGLIVIILALVGIVSLVISGVNGVKYLLDDEDTKRAYDTMLDPVVMLDPRPFKTIDEADPAMLTEISLRMTLMEDDKGEKYPMDDQGMMSVPLSDIEKECKKTFGDDAKIQTGDLDKGEITFKYNAATNSYLVPVMGEMGYYKAYVESIKKIEKNKYELTVGYIPSSVEWGEDKQGNKVPPKPEKYMTYVLEGEKGSQIITSIQQPVDNVDGEESK